MSDDSTNLRQEFVTELESILESDEAYGSNLQILTYGLKEDVINGKFKDSWNNRVYEFIVDVDGISYKPAAKLDSFNADELPIRFDAYSKGYASLFRNERLDRNLIGKRVKKPKCGSQGYGCGFSCIDLLKTCRILSSGKKTRGEQQGKAIGKERLNKLILMSGKLYAMGNKGGAALASATANKVTEARNKKAGQLREVRKEIGRQVVVKKPESIKSVTATKLSPKSQEEKPAKSMSDPTANPKTHSIKNQKDFEDVFLHVVNKIVKNGNNKGDTPIHQVREAIGELVPRDKFNEYMKDLQAKGNIQLIGGSGFGSGEFTGSREYANQIENSITTKANGIRFYIRVEKPGKDKSDKLDKSQQDKIEKQLDKRPELDPMGSARQYAKGNKITSQKEFNEIAEKVFETLDEEFNQGGLVSITKVKNVLKDRVPKESLDKMLIDFQDSDKYQLVGHGTLPGQVVPKELVDGEVRTRTGDPRHYIKKTNFK